MDFVNCTEFEITRKERFEDYICFLHQVRLSLCEISYKAGLFHSSLEISQSVESEPWYVTLRITEFLDFIPCPEFQITRKQIFSETDAVSVLR
jgi:hypothetical protein